MAPGQCWIVLVPVALLAELRLTCDVIAVHRHEEPVESKRYFLTSWTVFVLSSPYVAADRLTDALLLGNDNPNLTVGYYVFLFLSVSTALVLRLTCCARLNAPLSTFQEPGVPPWNYRHFCLCNLSVCNGSIVYNVWDKASWNRLTTKAKRDLSVNRQALLASPATLQALVSWLQFCAYRAHFFVFSALAL
jgi:hypothetical protein